jgi:cytochrome c553
MTRGMTMVVACAALLAASHAALGAGACGRQANLQRGARLARTCDACHGTRLSREFARGGPAYSAPRIGHQRAVYIRAALREYHDGVRASPVMRAEARALTRQDIEDVAAYYDAMPDRGSSPRGAHPAAVRKVALDQIPSVHRQLCGACHGEAGLGILPESPILAGQYADYLEHALRAYASGERRSKVMGPFARLLTSRQIRDVAEYFASQSLPERLPGSPKNLPLPLR